MKYVVSDEDSNSFVGPGTEQGTVQLLVDSSRFELRSEQYSSKNFTTFVNNFHYRISYQGDAWVIGYFYGGSFFQESKTNESFESIESVGEIDYNNQFCPPLREGQIILIRGFRKLDEKGVSKQGEKGVSRYCVKILVEEFRDK